MKNAMAYLLLFLIRVGAILVAMLTLWLFFQLPRVDWTSAGTSIAAAKTITALLMAALVLGAAGVLILAFVVLE